MMGSLAMLRISKGKVYELGKERTRSGEVRSNLIPSLTIGSSVRFRKSDVEAWCELPAEAIARIIHQVDELIDERVKLVHEIYGKSYLGRDGPTVDADMDPDGELCQLYDLRKKAAEYQVKLSLRKK